MSVGCLIITMALNSNASSKIEPTGTNISGAIQLDAIIELNRYSPDSLRQDYTIVFARYWVARSYYSVAVVWAEPQSTDMFFAASTGLSVSSNEHSFNICHQTKTKSNEAHKKPLGERGVFRHKFGSYPIDNIRFAEREYLAERIHATDLLGLEDANQADGEPQDISIPTCEGGDERDVAQLKIQTDGERIDSMKLFNSDKRLLKDISYEYENIKGKNCLRKLTAILPERPLMVGFKGEGVKVTLEGKEYRYRELLATHHVGGRTCIVEYETVQLGDKKVTFPVKVTVHNRKNGLILRCVQMMNFKQVELDADGAEEAAIQFGTFDADYCKYHDLREKYWKKLPNEIEEKDVEDIVQLKVRFKKALGEADKNTGEKLKQLNALIELNLIVGHESELEHHYRNYLSTLNDSKLTQMVLVGGYGVIETAMFRKRQSEAEKLLVLWVNAVLEIKDVELILFFAKSQLAKNRLWTTANLLKSFSNKTNCSADAQFEAESLRCNALGELYKLVHTNDIARKGLIAEIQANWVASISKDNLETMLADSMNQARRFFIELSEQTESQKALKEQLEEIEKMIITIKQRDRSI